MPKASLPSAKKVSIIIATAGRAVSLDRTLTSLRQLRYPHFEVIVILGPSSDHSLEIVKNHAAYVRYQTFGDLNLSAARNLGVAMARGDIVAFIDDDAIPEPDWLDQMLQGYDDARVAQVGGFIRDNRGIDYQARFLVVDRFGDSVGYEEAPEGLNNNSYLGLTGTNFSVRYDLLLQIGGFDHEYAYFLDETDVTVRLIDRGWISRIMPDAEIHHKFEASHLRTTTRVPRSMYATARSKAYFCCVHARKQYSLHDIVEYLADFVRKERAWKADLYRYGHTDQATAERLIKEVERGVSDGVRDAFLHPAPRGLTPALLSQHSDAAFKPFPLPRPASERLRICFLSQDYPPVGNGGIGQWTRSMATGLARRGHETTVICRSETDYPYIDFIDGVWVHRIKVDVNTAEEPVGEDVPLSLLNYSAALNAEIARIQPRRQFDIVSGPIFDLEPLVALRQSGIPTVVSLHTAYKLALPFKPEWSESDWYRKNYVDKVIAKEKELLATAPLLEANTRALISNLEAAYGVTLAEDRAVVVAHGLEDLSEGVEPFATSTGEIRLLFVGRLELRKGADLLLEALPKLLNRHPNLVVDIVGEDGIVIDGKTLRAGFEEIAARARVDMDRVHFHGSVERECLLRHYASCDIFVAPSRYESFGLIFVEAMIFSKPVVGIAVGGVTEVITHGIDGLLIPTDDAELLAETIDTLADDAKLREKLGQAGRKTYETRFHITHMLDQSEEYYRKIAIRPERFE